MISTATATGQPAEHPALYRHICGWCHRDLGALWQGSQHHSYAICETCKQAYFAYLYEPAAADPNCLEQAPTPHCADFGPLS
jgi:hypothetical protein